jgi:MazG family protein
LKKTRPFRFSRANREARARRAGASFARLVRLMDVLRSPRGCPWDRRQTHASLRRYLLEESYEVLDTIDRRDLDSLPGELGDVLLQCVFHAQLAAEAGRFDAADVVNTLIEKLIRRHPHVFEPSGRPLPKGARGRAGARSPAAVVEQWAALKARERTGTGEAPGVLAGVPRALPALLRAYAIGGRVADVGFDWANAGDVLLKMDEELGELRRAIAESPDRAEEELGDFLFALVNLARKLKVDPEVALRRANEKFARRFAALEAIVAREGRSPAELPLEELERVWQSVKAHEREASSSRTAGRTPSPPRSAARRSRSSPRRRGRS